MCCRLRRRSVNASLAHVERNGAWAAYLRWTYLEDRAKLMQWWADYLDGRKMGKLLKMKKTGPLMATPGTFRRATLLLPVEVVRAVGAKGENPVFMRV
jgi:hypothetical protein